MNISKALSHGWPNAEYVLDPENYEGLKWLEKGKKPTEKQIKDAWDEYKSQRDAKEYKQKRAAEYPEIGEQLDAILKGFNQMRLNGEDVPEELDNILGKWLAVKQKYPKEPKKG